MRVVRVDEIGPGGRRSSGGLGCSLSSLRRFAVAGGLAVRSPGALEDVDDAVISFVAAVLVRATLALQHRNLSGPWLRPRRRIARGELVDDPVGAHSREAFDNVETGA